MQVKDINKNVSNMFAGSKPGTMPLMDGEDFLSMLNAKETAPAHTKDMVKISPAADGINKTSPVSDNKGNIKKTDSKVKDSIENQPKKAEKNAKPDSRKDTQKADSKKEKISAKTKEATAEAVPMDAGTPSVEEAPSAEADAAPAQEIAVAAAGSPVVDAGSEQAPLDIIPVDFISSIDSLTVTNPLNGGQVTLTGEELAEKLISGEWPHLTKNDMQRLAADYAAAIPADVKGMVTNTGGGESFFADGLAAAVDAEVDTDLFVNLAGVAGKENTGADEEAPAGVASEDLNLSDVAIKEQVEKLEELLGADKKTKVEVNTEVEKASVVDLKNLASNHLSLQEVGDDAAPEAILDTPEAQTPGAAQSQQASINMDNIVGFNNLVIQNIESSVGAKSVDANIGSISSQTVSSGGEYLTTAKNDILAANDKTSFRDVYKGMSKEVVDQVKINITKSAVKGVDKIDIRLRPAELGSIEVKMQIGKDGKLQAHIISSNADAMEALQRDLNTLEKAFNDAGFETNEKSFTFSSKEQESNQNKEQGLRDFLGNALEGEADLLSQSYLPENWDGKSALNIRV